MANDERQAIARGSERDRRVSEAVELLDSGVERILDGEEFKRYLAFAAKFHRYSANNSLLVLLQRPNATKVAGYKKWRDLGRQVRQGEEGLRILAPIFRAIEDEESGEKTRVLCSFKVVKVFDVSQTGFMGRATSKQHAFKVVKVFDVSQTDPIPGAEPMPEKPRPNALRGDSDDARILVRTLLAFCESEGVPVLEDDACLDAISPNANGLYSLREKYILLRRGLTADQRAKTLAHEIAHYLLHRDMAPLAEDRLTLETEAEGVAYAVLSYFGVDASEYSFAYVARWAGEKEVLKSALVSIQVAVRTIISAIEDGGCSDTNESAGSNAA